MKSYSKLELDNLKEKASQKYNTFSKNTIDSYKKYLQQNKGQNRDIIVLKAYEEKLYLSSKLKDFVYDNYPKTEEYLENGVVRYTVETHVFIHLMINNVFPSDKRLDTLYQEYLKSFDDSNP